jgi:hypothetical protein
MFRRTTFAVLAAATVALGGLTACSPITSYSGFQAIVRAKLGSPSVQSTFDPNVWFYVNQIKQRVAFRKPQVTARNVTAIAFNKDSELVETVNVYTLKDGKVIAYNTHETPTRGREMTVLEQLLGSVGRGGLLPQDDTGVPGQRPGDRR